jgi:hypothetical protein
MTHNILRTKRRSPAAAAFIVAALAVALAPLSARAVITDTDWSLKISERELAFRPPSDAMAMKTLMWDLPANRRTARSLPTICLTNDSATASISQFKMTIGDEQFNFGNSFFGTYAKLGKDTPGFTFTSSTEDNGNTLVVNFGGSGVAPGQTVNFLFDIDPDAGLGLYAYPDYRTVLFDMNGDNYFQGAGIVNDPSSEDNGTVQLTFIQSGMPAVTTVPVAFDDPNVLDGSARFVNGQTARYGESDPVRAFPLEGGAIIPEPSSAVLCLFGLAATFAGRRRRG